ncbi:MAG: hypothetical protein H7138_27290 [Myxococcales bacterium]|nr:hypothetical protein [Myxococcales bacterium]
MSMGVALLVAGHIETGPRRSLLRTLGQIEAALVADSRWRVSSLGFESFEPGAAVRSQSSLPELRGDVAIVVVVGPIAARNEEHAVVLTAASDAPAEVLSLGAITAWIRASGAARAAVVLAG